MVNPPSVFMAAGVALMLAYPALNASDVQLNLALRTGHDEP